MQMTNRNHAMKKAEDTFLLCRAVRTKPYSTDILLRRKKNMPLLKKKKKKSPLASHLCFSVLV